MKIVGIGDLFIPSDFITKGFKIFEDRGDTVEVFDWKLKDFDELQHYNLLIEQGGIEDFEVPQYALDKLVDADMIITQFFPINSKVISACKNLKYIGVLRAGMENVNRKVAEEKGITVFNTPGRNADSVADFALGMILCEARNIAKGHYGLKNGKWIREYPNSGFIPELPGRTVGIIGYGEIGRKVEKRLSGFDSNVLIFDPFFKGEPAYGKLVTLDTLMKESDFITIHARLTEENAKMIGKREIGLMKPTAYLINTSRAGLVDEEALYEALKEKKIMGAALDVFELEPPPKDYPLCTLDNVTITPHMAGGSSDAFINTPVKLAKRIIDKI